MTTELATIEQPGSAAGTHALAMLTDDEFALRLESLKQGRERIAEIQRRLMRPGVDFGKIPGTGDRPTLLKPGAEKLADFYQLAAGMSAEMTPGDGERTPLIRYEVRCTLHLRSLDGPVVASGWGVCTSHEKKYRYRNEWTNGKKQRVVNDDPWEQANTILKIAEKRAFIDAVLRATASSGLFTQDVGDDDLPDEPVRPASRTLPIDPSQPTEDELRMTIAQTLRAHGKDADALQPIADEIGVKKGDRANREQLVEMLRLLEASFETPGSSVPTDSPATEAPASEGTQTSEIPTDGGLDADVVAPEGVPPSSSGAPTLEDVLAVTGGELVPPKPGSDEYRSLSAMEKSQARAYWARAQPQGARETHEPTQVGAAL